jgi:glycosyltransferase involved in cell wall biosynthesis
MDSDTTLPAVAAMPDRPSTVRLVKNDLGRGVLNALRSGFQAAAGDVVVTFMADLSDPPEVIVDMVRKIRQEGADVVGGSRYMKGGRQIGGPLVKRTLSRLAGFTLHWLAGLPTRDPTTNFRAYRREFLCATKIESSAGFELALELTVKAHLGGYRVAEVPSIWRDRTAGESRFRLIKWMPFYLRWFRKAILGRWRRTST